MIRLRVTKWHRRFANEADIQALPLYTFEGDSESRDYVTVMKANLEELKKGFKMKASKQISESLPIMILLTLSGGFMDAYSYLCRGEVFANAQTGNILCSVLICQWGIGARHSNMCVLFGICDWYCGGRICEESLQNRKHVHWRQIIVFCEAVILFGVMFIPQELNLLANSLTSLACGAQVESFQKDTGQRYGDYNVHR